MSVYLPASFREERLPVLHATLAAHPFATLASLAEGGLQISHLPWVLAADEGPCGTLYGHVARANAHARCGGSASTAIFLGPHAYVSAGVYPGKSVHGREVPTWNYVAVHAHGKLETFEDPARLRALLVRLTDQHERGRADPWQVDDAPADYVERLLGAIIGLRLPIERLEGKFKLSQNRSAGDRSAVREALAASEEAQARAVAALMGDSQA